MKSLRIALALMIIGLMLVFSINNSQTVQVIFFSYRAPPLPLFLILGCSFLLGFLVALLLAAIRISRLRRQLHQARRGLRKDSPDTPPAQGG